MYCVEYMVYHSPDSSTYSAIFAALLLLLIIFVIAYNSVQKVYQEYAERRERYAEKEIVVQDGSPSSGLLNNDTVLYEGLTDEEAESDY